MSAQVGSSGIESAVTGSAAPSRLMTHSGRWLALVASIHPRCVILVGDGVAYAVQVRVSGMDFGQSPCLDTGEMGSVAACAQFRGIGQGFPVLPWL